MAAPTGALGLGGRERELQDHGSCRLQTFSVQPDRHKYIKLSTHQFIVEKDRDILGLYMNPPGQAMLPYVNEKTKIQALELTQPPIPMVLVEGMTHKYSVMATPTCSHP
jgi:putative transposase